VVDQKAAGYLELTCMLIELGYSTEFGQTVYSQTVVPMTATYEQFKVMGNTKEFVADVVIRIEWAGNRPS
jgi:hypothetical protein